MMNNALYLFNNANFWKKNVNLGGLQVKACSLDRLLYLLFHKFEILGREDKSLYSLIIRPGMQVVDVGANIGLLSMEFARLVGSNGHVYSFEPEPKLFNILEQNCRNNGFQNISCFNMAVGEKSGKSLLFRPALHLGDSRMFGEEKSQREKIAVNMSRLDEVLNHQHIDFVKIDVQGYEMQVLKGMERLIEHSSRLSIMFEYWPQALRMAGTRPEKLLEYLRDFDFQIYQLNREHKLSEVDDASSIQGTKSLIGKYFLSLVAIRDYRN